MAKKKTDYQEPEASRFKKDKGSLLGIPLSENPEQRELAKYLRDPNYPIVYCFGDAGTGKTLIATAAGIEQKKVYKAYDKVLYVREPLEVGASLGFLPGTVDEKYGAYMGGLYDNIRVIASYSGYNENNLRESVECVPPQYMRGRSLESTYVIVDEAQNLNLLSIRTLLTRMGRGGKIVLLGSENQVDIKNWKGGETDFGKSYKILSKFGFVARVDLVKSERSDYCALIDGAFGDYLKGKAGRG